MGRGLKMNCRNAERLALAWLLLVAALAAGTDPGKPISVKGYVLDSACAFTKNLKKPISAECAVACAKAGSPLVMLSDDGTIYWPNGDLDFLPPGGGEPHGYDEFIAGVDAIVIGRKTFETVLTLGPWPYGNKRVVVLSSRPLDLSAASGGVVEQMGGPPAQIVSQLAATGAHHLYVDGGITIQGFLRAGLIQRLIITSVPC